MNEAPNGKNRRKEKKRRRTNHKPAEDAILPASQASSQGNIPTQSQNTFMTEQVGNKLPPIIIHKEYAGNMTILDREFKAKYNSNFQLVCTLVRAGVSVQVTTRQDFVNLLKLLTEKNVPHHILKEPGKVFSIVIRGVPSDVEAGTVAEALLAKGYEPLKVTNIISSSGYPYPIYAVDLPDTAQNKTIYNLRGLCCYAVRVENRRATPIQCRNCQKFLHKSNVCRAPPCCRICAGEHPARECELQPDEPRCCANCYGEHPADSKSCRFRHAAMQATSSLQGGQNPANCRPTTPTQTSRRPTTPTQPSHRPTQTQNVPQRPTKQTSPEVQYSTVVTRAEIHAEASPPQPTCSREQQRLQMQQQQKPKEQDTRVTQNTLLNPTRGERSHALEELRRLERESNLRERSELELIARGSSNQQLVQRPSSPKSPRRRRDSGGRRKQTRANSTDTLTEVQQLKEQISNLQTELQRQQQTLRRQTQQIAESQAKLNTDAKRLREERRLFENEKRKHSQHSQDSDTDNNKHRHHRREKRHSRRDRENNFSERAENVAYSLRHMDPYPGIPRLMNAFHEGYTRLRNDPNWHTLAEVLMSMIGHLIGSYDHTYPMY